MKKSSHQYAPGTENQKKGESEMECKYRLAHILTAGLTACLVIGAGLVQANTIPEARITGAIAIANDAENAPGWSLSLPLYFEENKGQTDASVQYIHRSSGMMAFLRETDVVMRLPAAGDKDSVAAVVSMSFVGAEELVAITGNDRHAGRSAYFKGSDPDDWVTDVPHFSTVTYHEVYSGIDVIFHGIEGRLRYDFHVAPGADSSQIRLAFSGVDDLRISDDGDLILKTPAGDLVHRAPAIYQEVEGSRTVIDGQFQIGEDHDVIFTLASYDKSQPLVIDPIISYSTYHGGSGNDSGRAVRMEADGAVIVTGDTDSVDFPTVTALQPAYGGGGGALLFGDIFISKIAPDGASLIFSTYLGGSSGDSVQNMELDSGGNILVGGRTSSTNFPTTVGAAQTTYAGGNDTFGNDEDAFLAKLAPDGSSLIFSTYLGGFDIFHPFEEIRGFAIDGSDNVYVIGNTGAADFPATHVISAACVAAAQPGSADVFVAKYSPAGTLLFATCFGGSGRDTGRNLAFDSFGNLYVNGWTTSTDFPTTAGVVQPASGGPPGFNDGWLAKLNGSATSILFSTYLGGAGDEFLEGLAVDASDNVVVSGQSSSTDYPVSSALQPTLSGSFDAVISKLNPTGTAFLFSTYFGGTGEDFAWGLKLDSADRIYFTGYTGSPDYPVVDPIQATFGGVSDSIVTQLSADGSTAEFSTYLGGSLSDSGSNGIHVLGPGELVVTGSTLSTDFPVVDPLQAANAGVEDGYVTRLSTPVEVPVEDCTATAGGCNPTGGQEIVLPDNFVVPPGATITQTPTFFVDPRADANGRCDGLTPLVLFDGALIIPPEFCGSPEFEVLVTDTNIEILEGTVLSTVFPEVFVNNPLGCDRPITGDPQLQDIVVWQPDDSADVIEGRALELTFDCGSSRGRTRRLSFFVVGMHIDFGLDFNSDPQDVTQAFIDLTSAKIDSLLQAVENAEPALDNKDKGKKKKKKKKKKDNDFDKLKKEARDIQKKFDKGQYDKASRKLASFLKTAERADFDIDIGFNHQGNLISRASNIKFTIDEKIVPFVN